MFFRKFFLIVTLGLLIGPAGSQSLKILTYNIRFDNPADGANAWTNRRAWLCDQIHSVAPDLFGIQEGLVSQINYLDSAFSDYRHIGVGRSDGKNKGEFSAIYYNSKRFTLTVQGTFWLSPTPEKASVGWDAALERICTYGLFQDPSTGRKFWMFNTHFDHVGTEARKNSALLILQKMKSLNTAGYPVILTGDFNATPESEPIKLLCAELQDSQVADKSMMMGPGGTFNDFDPTKPATQRIDYIFSSKGFHVTSYFVPRQSRDGRYASDHFPVIATFKFNPE
ncbi:MAG: endonuclease/exonuclease/phosphatase family protein [Bacteroidales bacterium]|jgi:endonuclease/exonuclease/phosphatase family metal-dependent hydrolase|nr:endonuclease/exonuclease/phosphatase family protein [Bacteroidales bacterium]